MLSGAANGSMHLEVQACEARQHALFRLLKNDRFSAEIWAKICLKLRTFLEKAVKSQQCPRVPSLNPRWLYAAGDFGPRPPHLPI